MEKLFEQHIERMEKLQSVYEPHTGQHNILGMLINECKQALHKHSVMQSEASEGAKGAAVGNCAAGKGVRCGKCEVLGHLAPCDECYLNGKIDSGG